MKRVVAITGCDSGLGWAIAARTAREGFVTVAGMYCGIESKAAIALKDLKAHPRPLDVTKENSVVEFKNYVDELLKDNPDYRLYAVVNNAGVMTIGDYEWQTQQFIQNAVNVNLVGAMTVTSNFLPTMRKVALEGSMKPRLINIASHCGLQPLPGFGPYSASKAGLIALTQSIRMEYRPYGLTALYFIPGGFVDSSNLMARQTAQFKTMLDNLDEEQRKFYGKRIAALSEYLKPGAVDASYDTMRNEVILETFMSALSDENPKEMYKVESPRYLFYYNLLKLPMPEAIRYQIIKRFLSFPDV